MHLVQVALQEQRRRRGRVAVRHGAGEGAHVLPVAPPHVAQQLDARHEGLRGPDSVEKQSYCCATTLDANVDGNVKVMQPTEKSLFLHLITACIWSFASSKFCPRKSGYVGFFVD